MEGYISITEWIQDIVRAICLLQDEAGNFREGNAREGKKESFMQNLLSIEEKEQAGGILIPAVALRQYFDLTELEYWLVLTALSMEADTGLCLQYRGRYGREVPDFQYGIHLLSGVLSVEVEFVGELCDPDHQLWQLFEWQSGEEWALTLQKPMKLRRTAVSLLLTGRILLPSPGGRYLETDIQGTEILFLKTFERIRRCLEERKWKRILFHGRKGSGKKTLLQQICYQLQISGILVELRKIWELEAARQEQIFRDLSFAAQMAQGIIIFSCDVERQQEALRLRELADRYFNGQTLFLLTEGESAKHLLYEMAEVVFDLPDYLPIQEKKLLLDLLLPKEYRESWQDAFVGRYRLSAGELTDRLRKVTANSEFCGGKFCKRESIENGREYNKENDAESARNNRDSHKNLSEEQGRWSSIFQAGGSHSSLGKRMDLPYTLSDYAGPEACRRQLEQVIRLAGIWREQTENWNAQGGFFPESLCILFHGSSGTGKTMSASVLANELGMSLLRVDLSSVFDKYIGETEKHLEEILNSAQRSNAILFFDEADALFSKRTEISDSHDKYANVSVSYLLQRIEEYSGIIILATNLINQFDDAFLRRIRFVLRFQPLDEEQRAGLWETILSRLPAGYLLADEVCAAELAASADLSPARIKNCVMTAVLLAASEGMGVISRNHIRTAIRWEAQKDHTACNFWDSEDIS